MRERLTPKVFIPQAEPGTLSDDPGVGGGGSPPCFPLRGRERANTRLYLCGLGGVEGVRVVGDGWAIKEPQTDRRPPARKKRWVGQRSERYKEHRLRQLRRAKTRVRRLVKVNRLTRMITLTFALNVCSIVEADVRFWRFTRQLDRRGIRWIAVREFQKRGAVHYHLLYDRFVPWDWMWKWWSRTGFKAYEKSGRKGGFDYVRPVGPRSGVRVGHAAGYLCKYVVKGADDERLEGHHSYLRARELKEPEMVEGWTEGFAEMLVWMIGEFRERNPRCADMMETDYIWDKGEVQAAGLSPP